MIPGQYLAKIAGRIKAYGNQMFDATIGVHIEKRGHADRMKWWPGQSTTVQIPIRLRIPGQIIVDVTRVLFDEYVRNEI